MTDPIQIKHYKEDITSFNQLYKEFQRRFVRFANTYVRDLTTAEDITIEAMMYYWENRRSGYSVPIHSNLLFYPSILHEFADDADNSGICFL